jgi:predicted restriction endonuclease
MKEGQTLWTKEQSKLALNLYSKIPFGQMHHSNEHVQELAKLIGRSSGAVARKLGNFASLDPKLRERGIKGLPNTSKLDEEVWNEFMRDWDVQFIESEKLLAERKNTTVEKLYNVDLDRYEQKNGRDAIRMVKVRLDQKIFRGVVLSNFNNQCCITGIKLIKLIVASHIVTWRDDSKNRLNPKNGLALNALHDKAFDKHLITVTEDLKIKISSTFYKYKDVISIKQNFIDFDNKELIAPQKFDPDAEFLKIHNDKFAKKSSLISD